MSSATPTAGAMNNHEESSLRDICSVLFRHKWKSVLFFLVVVALIALGTFTAPDVYEVEAKLLLKPGRESLALDPAISEDRVISVRRTAEEQLRSELEILNSRALAEEVLDAVGQNRFLSQSSTLGGTLHRWLAGVGLTQKLAPRDRALRSLRENLVAEAILNTNILQVTFQCQDPGLAYQTLNELITRYKARHLALHGTDADLDFFLDQVRNWKEELAGTEVGLRQFKNMVNIADLDEQRTEVIKRISALQTRAEELAAQVAGTSVAVEYLQEALAQLPQMVILREISGAIAPYMDDARLTLFQLRLQEKELLAQYPEKNRLVKAVRERISKAEEELEGLAETGTETMLGVNTTYQDTQLRLMGEQADLASLSAKKRTVDRQLAAEIRNLRVLNDNEMGLLRLERERDIAEDAYRASVERLNEARNSQALETENISNVAVIQGAYKPTSPVKPRKGRNMLIALLLGMVGGIGLAFFCEHLDHTFRTREQVEQRLGIPVLVTIPKNRKLRLNA